MKIGPARSTSPSSGLPLNRRVRVVEHHQVDVLQLAVRVDVRVGDGQVIRRRQALLLRAVLRIGLHVLAEHLAGDRGDHLVGGHRTEAADRVARASRSRRAAAGRGLPSLSSASGWSMPTQKKSCPSCDHVLEHGDDVAGPHVAAAQPGRAAGKSAGCWSICSWPVLPGDGVAEGRLDLARQVVAGGRERIVHPFEDA